MAFYDGWEPERVREHVEEEALERGYSEDTAKAIAAKFVSRYLWKLSHGQGRENENE